MNGRTMKSHPSTAATLDALQIDTFLLETFIVPKVVTSLWSTTSRNPSPLTQSWVLPLVQAFTVMAVKGQTPGIRLLGLDFQSTARLRGKGSKSRDQGIRKRLELLSYVTLRFLAPAMVQLLKRWAESYRDRMRMIDSRRTAQSSSSPLCLAMERKLWAADNVVSFCERVYPAAQLASLLLCWSGIAHTPDLAMQLTGWTFGKRPQQQDSTLHVDFAHRRWLWDECLNVARLLSFETTQSLIHDVAAGSAAIVRRTIGSRSKATCKKECPSCRRRPLTSVMVHPCGHVYCYACVQSCDGKCITCGCAIRRAEATDVA